MTIDQRFEIWAKGHEQRGLERGLLEGEQKGRQEGKQSLLQKLLTKRFGPLPEAVLEQIRSASTEQIDTWADRVFDATSLDAVFRVH